VRRKCGHKDSDARLLPKCRDQLSHLSLIEKKDEKESRRRIVRQVRNGPEMEGIESCAQLQAYIYRKAHADKVKEPILAAEPIWKGDRAVV
jgi:hypothetical protein